MAKDCFGKMSMNCIPQDAWQFILKKQLEFRMNRPTNTKVNLQETVIRIIKAHPDFKK